MVSPKHIQETASYNYKNNSGNNSKYKNYNNPQQQEL